MEHDLFMNIYFTHKKPCKDSPSLQRIGIVCRCPNVLDHHGSFFLSLFMATAEIVAVQPAGHVHVCGLFFHEK